MSCKMYGDYGKAIVLLGVDFETKMKVFCFFLTGQVKFFSSFIHLRDKPFLHTDYFQFRYIKYVFHLTEKKKQNKNPTTNTQDCTWGVCVEGNFR